MAYCILFLLYIIYHILLYYDVIIYDNTSGKKTYLTKLNGRSEWDNYIMCMAIHPRTGKPHIMG